MSNGEKKKNLRENWIRFPVNTSIAFWGDACKLANKCIKFPLRNVTMAFIGSIFRFSAFGHNNASDEKYREPSAPNRDRTEEWKQANQVERNENNIKSLWNLWSIAKWIHTASPYKKSFTLLPFEWFLLQCLWCLCITYYELKCWANRVLSTLFVTLCVCARVLLSLWRMWVSTGAFEMHVILCLMEEPVAKGSIHFLFSYFSRCRVCWGCAITSIFVIPCRTKK